MADEGRKKTVLITGCTPGGIGEALCNEFHSRGFHVIATARRPHLLGSLRDAGMSVVPLDVSSAESIAACKKEVQELTDGYLDILVNNAGLTYTVPATDINMDEIRQTFEANVFGIMAMVQAFAPLLIKARGLIIMISSLSSLSPYVFGSVYCATKVLVSLTGTVKSQIAKADRSLPPDSIYLPIKEDYARRLLYSQNNATVESGDYAKKLVDEAVKAEGWLGGWIGGAAKWFWAGGMTTQIWLSRLLFGEWLLDNMAYKKFGLSKLETIIRQKGIKAE
ncbi:hypothetical protein MRS44_016051 [Fusarium solani]|uniref:uncharacterized protein n=1 Tax=Fusarium solani TaxID=169388 RepID=UPI0032C40FA9|nr:hypothetical protein MRS44_016051 [Fusarium solani]